MKTPAHLILTASLGASLALAQENPPNPSSIPRDPPPAPSGEPRRPEAQPPRIEGERRLRPSPDEAHSHAHAEQPRPDGLRPPAEPQRRDGDRRHPDARPRSEGAPDHSRAPGGHGGHQRHPDARPVHPDARPAHPDARPGNPAHPPRTWEHQVFRRDARPRLPDKPQPYLGIVTRQATPELSAQLRQPEGFGLIVEQVLPESPAKAAGLEQNDLLIRFDDQLLANSPQLEALVRRAGKDKETALTILRGGAEQKLTVKVGEKMLPEKRPVPVPHGMPFNPRLHPPGQPGSPGPWRQLRSEHDGDAAEGDRQVFYASARARAVRQEESGRYELAIVDGARSFTAQKTDGTVAWQGPVETPAQRDAVPAELQPKLELLLRSVAVDEPKDTAPDDAL